MNEEKRVWGIHTKDENLFLRENVIAIGWKKMGDLSKIAPDRETFRTKYEETYPDAKKGNIALGSGMLYRFLYEAKIGDYVIFPSKFDRKINIGQITSDYIYEKNAELYPNRKKVKWLKHISRTDFSQGALYESGAIMTFFAIKNYASEFLAAVDKKFKPNDLPDEDTTVTATAEAIIDSTKDFILKELSRNYKGYDLENFVADLLKAMGYHTKVSPHGGDSGIDIVAYKDELPPRIIVQVKSQNSDITENTIQSLKGAMREGDYGVFVTLSDFTKNAYKYLENMPIIRGINGTELVELILKYYDKLSEKYQKIIPLKMVYIPVSDTEEE